MVIDDIFLTVSIIILWVMVIRWVKRRNVPSYDTVWWEFAGASSGLYLVGYNWEQGDWLSVAIIGLWTIFRFVNFSRAMNADEEQRKLTDISN